MFKNTSLGVNVSLPHHVSVMHQGPVMPRQSRKKKRDVFRMSAEGVPEALRQ
jgi:hypothetical protein